MEELWEGGRWVGGEERRALAHCREDRCCGGAVRVGVGKGRSQVRAKLDELELGQGALMVAKAASKGRLCPGEVRCSARQLP